MTKEKSPLENILGTKTSVFGCSKTTVSCLSTLGIVPLPRCASLAGRYIRLNARELQIGHLNAFLDGFYAFPCIQSKLDIRYS